MVSMKVNDVNFQEWNSKKNNFSTYEDVKSKLIYGELSEKIPFISVIIPTYKRANLLKFALDSAINQMSFEDYEIIVIDNDCEKDIATDILMKEYCFNNKNIYYYRNEKNIKMYGNWNRCIEICRTQWFCMLHDDDMLKENYFETVVPIIKEHVEIGVLSVYRENLDMRELQDGHKKYQKYGKNKITSFIINFLVKLRHGNPINIEMKDCINFFNPLLLCAVFNKQRAMEIGGYDEQYFPVSDLFFIVKMVSYYKVLLLPQYLWYYRYCTNESLNIDTLKKSLWFTRYLIEILAKSSNYSKRKVEEKYSSAVLFMWNGNSKLSDKFEFDDVVISYCEVSMKYRNKVLQNFIFFKRHIKRILLFLK